MILTLDKARDFIAAAPQSAAALHNQGGRNVKRPVVLFMIAVVAALAIGAATATAEVYAGPKTWLQGWDASGNFDSSGSRWYLDGMSNKSCYCDARVAFIDTGGTWHVSYTDAQLNTGTGECAPGCIGYTKKPYCKNNSSSVYTAYCEAYKW
jgi:hypothetical protein